MPLTPEQAAARATDTRFDSGEITEATKGKHSWSISYRVGSHSNYGFGISLKDLGRRKPPQVGDMVTVYGTFGERIRGVDLRGDPVYYRTPEEMQAEHQEWVRKHHADKIKRFEKDRRKLDRAFAGLPEVFQRRISWFRANRADWRWENEAYEMSVCVDAVKIAEAMKTPAGVRRFSKMSYKRQHATVPDLYDGHSGNSFSCAVRLAFLYLEQPLLVIAEHGALTPLVGCDDYGCAHPRPDDVEELVRAGLEEHEASAQ
jgi:hypothetical protein